MMDINVYLGRALQVGQLHIAIAKEQSQWYIQSGGWFRVGWWVGGVGLGGLGFPGN